MWPSKDSESTNKIVDSIHYHVVWRAKYRSSAGLGPMDRNACDSGAWFLKPRALAMGRSHV
jgi:hypothetical protein